MHTFHVYCSFADKPSIQTRLWLLVALLAVPVGEKSKTLLVAAENRFWNRLFSTHKTEVHVTQRRNECRIQWHRQQSILTSLKFVFLVKNGWPYTPLANMCPRACVRYTQTRIRALSTPTHKCICCQIWVNTPCINWGWRGAYIGITPSIWVCVHCPDHVSNFVRTVSLESLEHF